MLVYGVNAELTSRSKEKSAVVGKMFMMVCQEELVDYAKR
jgi:hypothetical protein